MNPQSTIASGTLHWKYFDKYFTDAACFAYDSVKLKIETRDDQERQKRFTRVSIISAALALESAANCCLDVLGLSKATQDEYDKLQTLGKFDIFLSHVHPRKHIDREHVLVRPIRNLITCRNDYVHSKVMLEAVTESKINTGIFMPLGLPHNSAHWEPTHAVKVFTVLADFLNYFFFEAVGYPYEGTDGRAIAATILSSAVSAKEGSKLPGDVDSGMIQNEAMFLTGSISREWDMEFAFLGGYTMGPENKQIFPKRKWGDYSHCKVEELTVPKTPIWYSVPAGLGIIMVGNSDMQKHRKK